MIDRAKLASLLSHTAAKIAGWRNQSDQLKGLLDAARVSETVSDSFLISIEETAAAIIGEITAHADIVTDVAATSPAAATELSPVSDALHLVLMEITELSTAMYAVRSQQPYLAGVMLAPPER